MEIEHNYLCYFVDTKPTYKYSRPLKQFKMAILLLTLVSWLN